MLPFNKDTFLALITHPNQRELARILLEGESIPAHYNYIKIMEMEDRIAWAKKGEAKYCETCSVVGIHG